MAVSVPVDDVIAYVIPEHYNLSTAEGRAAAQNELRLLAVSSVAKQYVGRRGLQAILMGDIDILITRDADEADRFQPAHNCPACVAGADQARAYLRDHPTKHIALGNIHYVEVWSGNTRG